MVDNKYRSWDYSNLINELEVDEYIGIKRQYIQVLRSSEPVFEDYRPILDYYETDDIMEAMYKIYIFDDKNTIKDKKVLKNYYLSIKSSLELIEAEKVLEEMRSFI